MEALNGQQKDSRSTRNCRVWSASRRLLDMRLSIRLEVRQHTQVLVSWDTARFPVASSMDIYSLIDLPSISPPAFAHSINNINARHGNLTRHHHVQDFSP